MSSGSSDGDLALAHRLADAASVVSLAHFRGDVRRWFKPDGTLASDADLAVEDAARALLAEERPGDSVLGEERGQTGVGERRWIIDGIDGTADFVAGARDWATLIALMIGDRLVLGLCDQPAHKRRYWAAAGAGAFASDRHGDAPRRLKVSGCTELRAARSYIPPRDGQPHDAARGMASALAAATAPLQHDNHPALQVAAGDYEVSVFLTAGPWDIAAPAVIVEEAGGRFSDVTGRRDIMSGTAVFSNGILHDDVLQVLKSSASCF